MRRIVWTRQAAEDIDTIAEPTRGRILARLELLVDFALMGAPMDRAYDGFRQLLIGRHRIIYQVSEHEIRIAYVRHGARQLGLRLIRGR